MRWDMDLYPTLGKYNLQIKIKTIIDTGMEKVTTRVDHYKGLLGFVSKIALSDSCFSPHKNANVVIIEAIIMVIATVF
jgi:hypothetical protein